MRTDWLTAVATLRQVAIGSLALRGVVAVAAAVAVVATTLPSWHAPDGYTAITVLAAIGYVIAPDSAIGVIFVGAVVVTWLVGAPGGVGPAIVITALALLVGHVAAALAASMPITARTGTLVTYWWRPTVAIAAGVLGAAGIVAVLDAWSLPGSAPITLAALAAATASAWWWSASD